MTGSPAVAQGSWQQYPGVAGALEFLEADREQLTHLLRGLASRLDELDRQLADLVWRQHRLRTGAFFGETLCERTDLESERERLTERLGVLAQRLSILDGGLSGEAEAIIPYEGGILVGGFFNRAGGVTVNNMALWGVVSSAEEDIAGSPSVEVFPNPVREAFFLQLPEGVFECAYILYDAMGRPVRRGRYSGREAISADGLAPGLYGLEVRTGTGVAMKKVMVGKAE